VLAELGKEGLRLGGVDAKDLGGEEAVDEETLPAALGVRAHDGMDDRGVVAERLSEPLSAAGLRERLFEAVLEGVLRQQPAQPPPEGDRQCLVRGRHREELRVALAARRDDHAVKDAAATERGARGWAGGAVDERGHVAIRMRVGAAEEDGRACVSRVSRMRGTGGRSCMR